MKQFILLLSSASLLGGCTPDDLIQRIGIAQQGEMTELLQRETTKFVSAAVQEGDEMNGSATTTIPDVLIDAPLILQNPELKRGCEVTSLAMMLQHAGVDVGKMQLAEELAKEPFYDGEYRGNPHQGFVGNMYVWDKPGIGVFNEPIEALANDYLPGRIVNLTNQSFDVVMEQLDKGKPVWVIVTSWFSYVPEEHWKTWSTREGDLRMTYRMHSVLITGYDDTHLYINDPFGGKNKIVNKQNFMEGWTQFGSQAISYN